MMRAFVTSSAAQRTSSIIPLPTANRAALLDRLADAELQHGHHCQAERLAQQAQKMRESAQ